MTTVRIATFNVHHCEGRDGRVDPERTARAIRATEASFVALQEIDVNMTRTGSVDQPELLAQLTGLSVLFAPTIERGGGAYGIAVAFDGTAEIERHALPRHGDEEPRIAIEADWNGLRLIATHLARNQRSRPGQTASLASLATAAPPPVVVLGDLNQGRRHLTPFLEAGFRPAPEPQKTLVTRLRRLEPDHILRGPGLRHERVWTVESDASDHLPLVAELEIL